MYRRRFDPAGTDSLARLSRWVPPASRVLELGAATGYFTAHLRERGCVVDVVEIDAGAAREAAVHAARTVVADLDGDRWVDELGDARYDAIVCADVIEHLRDPERLLGRLRARLAEGGVLLLSVPNVAHSAILAGLVDERFEYGGEGLLDPTHVRLYTWRSLAELLTQCGFEVAEWDATLLDLFETEFRVRIEATAPPLRELLLSRPHATVYQWLARARPATSPARSEPPALPPGVESVPVRLLHAATAAELTLDRAAVGRLPVGGPPVHLEWNVPSGTSALRLLLGDRIGVVELLDLAVHAGGKEVGSDRDARELDRSLHCVALDATTLALVAADAWIAPRIPEGVAVDRVTATLAWPGSFAGSHAFGVIAALARALRERGEAAANERLALTQRVDAAEHARQDEARAHAETRAALTASRHALEGRDADVGRLEEAVEGYRTENARLDAALAAQDRIIAYRQSLRWWLKLPLMRVKWWWHRATGR